MKIKEKKELENRIIDVIKTIYDPEIPVDIFELGLIYDVAIDKEGTAWIATDGGLYRILPKNEVGRVEGEVTDFDGNLLEYPHYTRPRIWEDREIPNVLLSGDHAKIEAYVKEQKAAYQSISLNLIPMWEACPMHAEAYNRTRRQHMDFTTQFVQDFYETSQNNRPAKFPGFHAAMQFKHAMRASKSN